MRKFSRTVSLACEPSRSRSCTSLRSSMMRSAVCSTLSTKNPFSPSLICRRIPPTLPPPTAAPFHIASVTVSPNPSRIDFCNTTAARRCSAFTSVASSTVRTITRSSTELWIVSRITPASGSSRAALPSRTSVQSTCSRFDTERLDNAGRVLPRIKTRDLHDQRTICRDAVMCQTILDLVVRQFAVLGREWIDRRRDEPLTNGEVLGIFGQIVLLDETPQVVPRRWIRRGEIDVALPDPRRVRFFQVDHQRQRLRVMYDHGIAIVDM